MLKKFLVIWSNEAYSWQRTYYKLVCSKITYAITALASKSISTAPQLETLISRARSLITDQSNTNLLQSTTFLMQCRGVYNNFILFKIFKNICEIKQERFSQKGFSQVIAYDNEWKSRINKKTSASSIYKIKVSKRPNIPFYKNMKIYSKGCQTFTQFA